MKLIGEKIIIRNLNMDDLEAFYDYGKSPNVGPNAGWKPFESKTIARRVLANLIFSNENYAIALKENNLYIGNISVYHDTIRKNKYARSLGFSLNEAYWNNGYITEAVGLIIKYIFDITDCKIIEAGHHTQNLASKRVIERNGFYYNGRIDQYKTLYDGRVIDADFYSLTKEDYLKKIGENI